MDNFKVDLKLTHESKKVKHFSRGISKYANAFHTLLRVGQSYLNIYGFKINLTSVSTADQKQLTIFLTVSYTRKKEQFFITKSQNISPVFKL